jgi:hypothetical protein
MGKAASASLAHENSAAKRETQGKICIGSLREILLK